MSKCIEWRGRKNGHGYGLIKMADGRRLIVHRHVYEKVHGSLRRDQLVCHRCDNRLCFNLDHLFVGSAADNNRDMARKDRVRHGSNHPMAKLTELQVGLVKGRLLRGALIKPLARELGLDPKSVRAIRSGKNWARVKPRYQPSREDLLEIITN